MTPKEKEFEIPNLSIIQLGRILDWGIRDGFSQEEADELLKMLILYKKPDDLDLYLSELKNSVSSLFDNMTMSIIQFKIKNDSFIQEITTNHLGQGNEALTIEKVVQSMKISRPTFYKWLENGLKSHKVGNRVYVYKNDLDDYVKMNQR